MQIVSQRELRNARGITGLRGPQLDPIVHIQPLPLRDLVFPMYRRADGAVHIKEVECFLSGLTGYHVRAVRRWLAGHATPPGDALGLIQIGVCIALNKWMQANKVK